MPRLLASTPPSPPPPTPTPIRPPAHRFRYRILIYSGDTDACVPTWGTLDWVDSLNLTVARPWRQWSAPHLDRPGAQRAGYVIEYAANGFTLATVQGAGHMVPTFKPHFAAAMMQRWLAREPLA